MDLVKLEETIKEKGPKNVAGIIMTITNNSAGGQPVSYENIFQASEIAKSIRLNLLLMEQDMLKTPIL